ncbi:MAG TPA: serine/threonine-protein kinase, partial [Vicinamibacterales bacterium]
MDQAWLRDVRAGTTIGPYEIIERLGLGGMGQVFLARDTRLQRKVALKILTPEGNRNEAQDAMREARAAARINHPNVASVYDVLEDGNGRPVIVMEYVDGENLASRLGHERLTPETVVSIGRQIASGLEAAHTEGIIHRDLKPSNVQLTRRGVAKILDFGIARATASIVSTRTGDRNSTIPETEAGRTAAGTSAYMSPEQKLGLRVDERSDIYSLGLLLFEMAAGRRANADDAAALALEGDVAARAHALDASIPRAMASIIARATALDPRNRFSSASEFERALATLISIHPQANLRALLSWRRLALWGAVVLLVSIGLVALFRTISPVHASIRSL